MTQWNFEKINLEQLAPSPELLKILPPSLMKKHLVMPFDQQGGKLQIAMSNPSDADVIHEIRSTTGCDLDIFMASRELIKKSLDRLEEEPEPVALFRDLNIQPSAVESAIPRIVDKLLEWAVKRRASDIHLEPQANTLFVRFRIDGALETIHRFEHAVAVPLISCIKVMASLDIAEKRLPQDGQIAAEIQGKEISLRVSTMPGKFGETTVIRVLDKSTGIVDLAKLGMDAPTRSRFAMMIGKPQGLVLVTGPTGSGKTTTLYSALDSLRSSVRSIITLEDPIEYELLASKASETGITQVQINPKAGFTFAGGLRAALRQDPDVIMVGEIRDKETAEVAMKAAMTGHLVLSTLHTNDAPSALVRLCDIGIEPYLIASTVTGVMAQRLLRLLCPHCKEAYQPPLQALTHFLPAGTPEDSPITLYHPKGCSHCHASGYWGRKGIYELLTVTDELRQLIQEHASAEALKKLAHSQGLRTLQESGLDLVFQGLTTIEEVFRHTVE